MRETRKPIVAFSDFFCSKGAVRPFRKARSARRLQKHFFLLFVVVMNVQGTNQAHNDCFAPARRALRLENMSKSSAGVNPVR